MLINFISGTTGEPKMVLHNPGYPLGHIVTARFWQDVKHNDRHFTVPDTGRAKHAWGKIFGQWIEGACIFGYHFIGKFPATEVLPPAGEVPDHYLLLPPDHLPDADPCGSREVLSFLPPSLHQRRRTADS